MNIVENYNKIINSIEYEYDRDECSEFLESKEIARRIAVQSGLQYRQMNEVFLYLTGFSLLAYIRERRLMLVYKDIVIKEIYDVDFFIRKSGYDSQSAMVKAFKNRFQESPRVAYTKMDKTKYEEPLRWDKLGTIEKKESGCENGEVEYKHFGIETRKIAKYHEAEDLQCLYELDNQLAEICFLLSENFDISLTRAFDFIDDYIKQDRYDGDVDNFYNYLVDVEKNYIKLCEITDMGVSEMTWFLKTIDENYEVKSEDAEVIDLWKESGLCDYSFYEIKEKLEKYKEKNEGSSCGFLDYCIDEIMSYDDI